MNNKILELCHHGIDKQRWGVKNGPPYPLDRKTHRHVISGKQDKELRRYGKKKVGISHLGDQYHRRYHQLEDFRGIQRHWGHDLPENREKGIHNITSYNDSLSNITNLATLIGNSANNGAAWRTLDRPGHKVTSEDLLEVNKQRRYQGVGATNDGYLDPGLSNNCAMCSASLFLRGLGYEVQAGRTSAGCKNTAGEYWFDGAKAYNARGARAIYEQMKSFGNQGKGMLGIRHKNGGGHSVYFQMEKQADGKLRPTIYDGQIAKKYNSLSDFLKEENADLSQFTRITRLDGTTPNWKHLAEDGVIRANLKDLMGNRNEMSREIIRDMKGGNHAGVTVPKDYQSRNFTFVNNDFTKEHSEEINMSKNGTYWTSNDTGDVWKTPKSYWETKAQADKDRQAREYLKQKYGIGV